MMLCRWFAGCRNVAATFRHHPILGDVPICNRCAARMSLLSTPMNSFRTRRN